MLARTKAGAGKDPLAFSPALLRMLSRTVHPTRGLFSAIFEQDIHPIASGMRVTQAVIVPPTYFRNNSPAATQTVDVGTGAAFDRESACWAAIGEGVERYAASIYFDDQVTWSDVAGLPGPALDLAPWIQTVKCGAERHEPRLPRGWMLGLDLLTQEALYVPAALGVLGYVAREPYEVLGQYVSTGLACSSSYDDAALRGLCEIIERDAFSSSWLLGHRPSRIEMDAQAARHFRPEVLNALVNQDLSVRIYLLAVSFGVTVVLGVGEHRELGFGVVGAAASISPVRAIEKAVVEVLHGWTGASALANRPRIDDMADFADASDHAAYYNNAGRWPIVARTLTSPDTVPASDLIAAARHTGDARVDLAHLVRAISDEGYQAAALDLSTADVRDLGLTVARAIVPGMQPLVFGPDCAVAPDQRRLDVWRARWGMPAGSPLTAEPHPFP